MICKHCKTEIEPPGFASNWPLHTDAHCRDVLQADLEYALSELEGCRTLAKGLYDAHATIDKLTAENTRLREDRDHWKQARESAMAFRFAGYCKTAQDMIRALGIDPSKEQKK